MKNELKLYIKTNLENESLCSHAIMDGPFFNPIKKKFVNACESREASSIDKELVEDQWFEDEEIDLKSWIQENHQYNDFQTMLFQLIYDRNLVDADVYNKVHIDRRLFSKIRNDKNYHPSKETILLLGFSLELSEEEIEKLLESASYSLPRNNHFDLIIRFCFMKGIYKLKDVNDLLDEYHCKLFNY